MWCLAQAVCATVVVAHRLREVVQVDGVEIEQVIAAEAPQGGHALGACQENALRLCRLRNVEIGCRL